MTATRSRGARISRRIVIVLVILVILLVVADRVGDYAAERTAGDTIQSSQHLSSRPDVDVDGFPFLTQLAAGEFDKITLTASDVPVDAQGGTLQINRVRVVLSHVSVSRDFSSVHADNANATADITYADLGKRLNADVSYAGSGRIKAAKSVSVGGQGVGGSVSARPELAHDAIMFADPKVDGLGGLGGVLADELNKVFDTTIPLQGIPFNMRVKSLDVESDGVHVHLVGSDISYSG